MQKKRGVACSWFLCGHPDIHQIRCVFALETSAVEAFSVEGAVIPT